MSYETGIPVSSLIRLGLTNWVNNGAHELTRARTWDGKAELAVKSDGIATVRARNKLTCTKK